MSYRASKGSKKHARKAKGRAGTHLDPFVVAVDIVGAKTDQLDVSLVEFALIDGSGAELGGADG